jgi:hypothetical protein
MCRYDSEMKNTIFGGCCTRGMLYQVYTVLAVCCSCCLLMIRTWWDREKWLIFVFCNNGRVMDNKERDWGWRLESCEQYEWIWEIRGSTCLIGLSSLRIGRISHRIRASTCYIGAGKLSHTWCSLCPSTPDALPYLSPSCPRLYHNLRIPSSVIPLYISMPWSRVHTKFSIHRVQHSPSTAYTEDRYTKFSIHLVVGTPCTASSQHRLTLASS